MSIFSGMWDDIFGSGMQESYPDYSSYLKQAEDLYNSALSSYHPSGQLTDYTNSLLNSTANKDYNSGLSGSNIESQNLSKGIGEAMNADQQQYLKDLYGVGSGIGQSEYAVDKYNQDLPMEALGTLGSFAGQLGGSALGSMSGSGGVSSLAGSTSSLMGNNTSSSDNSSAIQSYAPFLMSLLSSGAGF